MAEDVWIPLVDEPIGGIVARVQEEAPEIARLVNSPQRLLAFRTFAYIRVGLLLGELLVEHDPRSTTARRPGSRPCFATRLTGMQ